MQISDQRISSDGVITIKAQQFRSQDLNRSDALNRLRKLIKAAGIAPKRRRSTRISRGAIKRRLESKHRRGQIKALRKKVE